MKTGKLTLALAVALLAVGSAFATKGMFATAYVHILYSGAAQWECVSTGINCSQASGQLCVVRIPDLNRTTKAYVSNTCEVQQTNGSIAQAGIFDPTTEIVDAD